MSNFNNRVGAYRVWVEGGAGAGPSQDVVTRLLRGREGRPWGEGGTGMPIRMRRGGREKGGKDTLMTVWLMVGKTAESGLAKEIHGKIFHFCQNLCLAVPMHEALFLEHAPFHAQTRSMASPQGILIKGWE